MTVALHCPCSASDGLERTPFSSKETWTLLLSVEAGKDLMFFVTGSRPVFSLNDFILSGSYLVFVTKVGRYFSSPLFASSSYSGHFGLWVDENLYLGRSSPCYTFNNCCLSETDDFRVMELEVWTFS